MMFCCMLGHAERTRTASDVEVFDRPLGADPATPPLVPSRGGRCRFRRGGSTPAVGKTLARTNLLSSSLVNSASRGAKLLISVATWAVLARNMDPGTLGLFAMAIPFVQFLALFLSQGIPWIVIQDASIQDADVVDLFWANVAMGVLAALMCAAVSPVIALMYGESEVMRVMLLLALSLPVTALGLQHWAVCMKRMKVNTLASLDVGATAAASGAAILVTRIARGYEPLIVMVVLREVLFTTGLWIMVKWKPALRFKWSTVVTRLRKISSLIGASFLSFLGRTADNVLIGVFVGAEALGPYALAYRFVMAPAQMVYQAFGQISITFLSKLKDPDDYRLNYVLSARSICFLAVPGLVFLVWNADLLVLAVFGERWYQTVPLIRVLALTAIVQAPYVTIGWVFVSMGAPGRLLVWAGFSIPLTILAFAVGLPWGTFGVAIAYLIVSVLLLVPGFVVLTRSGKVTLHDLYGVLGPSLFILVLCSSILGGARLLIPAGLPYLLVLSVHVALLIALYLALLFACGRTSFLAIRQLNRTGFPGGSIL